jgi:hypothetical protein
MKNFNFNFNDDQKKILLQLMQELLRGLPSFSLEETWYWAQRKSPIFKREEFIDWAKHFLSEAEKCGWIKSVSGVYDTEIYAVLTQPDTRLQVKEVDNFLGQNLPALNFF